MTELRPELGDQFTRALEALVTADPDALWARLRLAARREKDHPEQAREHRRLAIAGWERIAAERAERLGPVDPSTVDARQFHADLAEAFGGQEGARIREATRIVADHERILGDTHPWTTWVRATLVRAYGHDNPAVIALADRCPLPDDEDLEPGDPGYPETDEEI